MRRHGSIQSSRRCRVNARCVQPCEEEVDEQDCSVRKWVWLRITLCARKIPLDLQIYLIQSVVSYRTAHANRCPRNGAEQPRQSAMAVAGKRRANRVHVAQRGRSGDDSESTSRTFGGADGMSVCSPGKPGRGAGCQHDKTAFGQPKVAKHVGSHAGGRNWVTGDGSQ